MVNYDQGHPWLIETDSHLCVSLNAQAGFGKDIQVVQEPCDGALRWQQWILHATTPGGHVYQIINNQNNDCLRALVPPRWPRPGPGLPRPPRLRALTRLAHLALATTT